VRNLYTASNQWASRPDDERFKSLGALLNYAKLKRERARQKDMLFDQFGVDADGDNVVMTKGSQRINFTNWSFLQFCSRLKAPPKFLAELPADLAVDVLRFRLQERKDDEDERYSKVLFDYDDGYTVRAFNGSRYTRVWDYQIVNALTELTTKGWDIPPAYDPSNFGGKKTKGHSGLYCGDRDCFVFMVNDSNRIEDGSDQGLARGFFVSNSEVGAAAWGITTFLYKYICGNHIVWGAEDVKHIKVRHVGDADQKVMSSLATQLGLYAEQSPKTLEAAIKKAKEFDLAESAEEVEDLIFSLRILPRKVVRAAIEEATEYEDVFSASPWSAWGLSQGVTRVSQREEFADSRVRVDQATEKILRLVN
jgi:hypothetical protein